MWKTILCAAAIWVWAAVPAAGAELYLKLGGGLGLFDPQQINQVLSDWHEAGRREADFRNNWTYLDGKDPRFERNIDFGGELQLSLSSRISMSVGVGFVYAELKPEDTEVRILKPLGETLLVQPTTLSAVPLLASVYYYLPLHSRLRLYVKAGTGLVWATFVEREGSRRETASKFSYTREEKATTRSPIQVGGLGIDFALESHVRFYLEANYRRLLLDGFSAEEGDNQTGTLYSYQEYLSDLEFWQTKNRLWDQPPTGAGFREVQETEVDLSGFSLVLGIAVRF